MLSNAMWMTMLACSQTLMLNDCKSLLGRFRDRLCGVGGTCVGGDCRCGTDFTCGLGPGARLSMPGGLGALLCVRVGPGVGCRRAGALSGWRVGFGLG